MRTYQLHDGIHHRLAGSGGGEHRAQGKSAPEEHEYSPVGILLDLFPAYHIEHADQDSRSHGNYTIEVSYFLQAKQACENWVDLSGEHPEECRKDEYNNRCPLFFS